ncbi:MAG: DUF6537 domain-containing protein, partial [Pseudomonadota bacterium]
IYTNPLMMGFAWQQGRIPLSHAALMRAIELNGVQVPNNKAAFEWGRRCAHDLAKVRSLFAAQSVIQIVKRPGVDEIVAKRVEFLTGYQNAAYAAEYRTFVEKVRAAEAKIGSGTALTEAVAKYLFKLMAYKDEYEVARLYANPAFWDEIARTFDGDYRVHFNLAPPLLARRDADGHLRKAEYGPWMRHAFRLLAKFRFLRGSAFDPFGRTAERRVEQRWIADYFAAMNELVTGLTRENVTLAAEIASVPEHIRGFGHVKERHEQAAREQWNALLARWRHPQAPRAAA